MAAVVETMQELGGHDQIRTGQVLLEALPSRVVFRLETGKLFPWMQHRPLLEIPLGIVAIDRGVPAALVAVGPPQD